ncbi:MAG: transcription antitermination factor NusB [Verrucomicrobia bacterium]|nr:transcription antitermination factor NusB [Verrucomicrobiota bacterium]
MGTRHESRELALQFLYQQDAQSKYPMPVPQAFEAFWNLQEDKEAHAASRQFAADLARGVVEHIEAVDAKIKACTQNWEFHRIAVVDRNILRLAVYELLFREDIPPVVSINEAIELAKKFSTEDSGRFVNGVLDRAKESLSRPLRTSSPKAAPPNLSAGRT